MKKRKGFTLIEMLMVIIIIGALTATVMISVSSATDKAKASKIVSNLRSLKAACVMYYSENGKWPEENVTFDGSRAASDGVRKTLEEYLDKTPEKGYKVYAPVTGGNDCAVSYSNEAELSDGIKEKLKKMASESGLLAANTVNSASYNKENEVFMRVSNTAQGTTK